MPLCWRCVFLGLAAPARAGKLSWLDDVVREVIAETRTGTRSLVRGSEAGRVELRGASRLFLSHDTEEGLEQLVKRSDELARAGRRIEHPSEALLQSRFSRLLGNDSQAVRSFAALEPAEKRLVVEMGEAARRIAQRYPEQAETMVRQLGPEGLSAVRVFGDDVAEVMVKEGPESLNVLRKTGKGGWSFFTHQVLPHKKKLAAAGILAAFLANPDQVCRLRGSGHRVRRPRVCQGRDQPGGRRRQRGRPGSRILDRRGSRRPWSGSTPVPLPRHGGGEPGGRGRTVRDRRDSRADDATAHHLADPVVCREAAADII